MIAIIDNYDSFTYNLVQRLGEIDGRTDIQVFRNDEISVDELLDRKPDRVIISPGPCTPSEAGISVECCQRLKGKLPLLGVCLGHQSMGQAYGATIVRAKNLMHGKTDMICHDGKRLFVGLDNPFQATRYHSLIVEEPLPAVLEATAHTAEGELMGVRHKSLPIYGVQFHPESILTECGREMLKNFLKM